MHSPRPLLDATNTVLISDACAVADAADRILQNSFGVGTFDSHLLHTSFIRVEQLFAGKYAGYLACDMPYHDLRHSLDTALVMARLVAGYHRDHRVSSAFTPEHGLLGVLLGLLHDTGFIRKTSESALCGPQLMREHEARSAEFAASYLRSTALAHHSALAELIFATQLGADLDQLFAKHQGAAITLGQMLGSADLLSQVSDQYYPERCFWHLYAELVLGRCDRVRGPNGQERLLYLDAFDLLRKTRTFYDRLVCKRINHDFQDVTRYLTVHFNGADPYDEAICRSLDRLARIVAEGPSGHLLDCEPITTTANVAAIYCARPRADVSSSA